MSTQRQDVGPAVAPGSRFINEVSGQGDTLPAGYVPPLVSNGSLSLLVDHRGGQRQRTYGGMRPCIWWAGRRYGPPHDQLVPFGHWELSATADGQAPGEPDRWTQTLDTQAAAVTCRHEYAAGLTVETTVFTPLAHDLVVVTQRVQATDEAVRAARLTLRYQFTPPGDDLRAPRRVNCAAALAEAGQSVEFRYQLDGYPASEGVVAALAGQPVTAEVTGQVATLSADVVLSAGQPAEVTFYLLFADTLDGPDHLARAAKLRAQIRRDGSAGLFAAHRAEWGRYWAEAEVRLPDERLERVYHTAQYHLRANATKWSFPVGVFDTHWAGRYFGWDEMFCYQALISSNHRDLARRCPEFRCAGLPVAVQRASHYNQPGRYGARFPWEAMEDGTEAVPPGFWMDHVFHMSNIALSAWFQYQYTHDTDYLRTTGYPVVRECARFFLANLVYEAPDGGRFIGKCTDLERLGPARLNPFMTSCGAIYTLEAAAQAAAILGDDDAEAADWWLTAAKLRESLPHDGDKYVPYAGCTERSVAALGGLFPYPLFDETEERQRRAVLDFVAEGRASGNMYPVGNSVCAWYAGWMAAALAAIGETVEPVELLDEAAAGAGCFAELFEINEAEVSMHPWFATASGNVVYALNQMLVQSRGDQLRIAAGVPESWRDFSFRLACHGDLVIEVAVADGRLTNLTLVPGGSGPQERTLVIPARLLAGAKLNPAAIGAMTEQDGRLAAQVRFAGRTELLSRPARG